MVLAVIAAGVLAALCGSAFANAPNPTAIVINSETVNGGGLTVTVSGTWTWDERVPNGPRLDCNDSRIGVGYAVSWGDNTANPLKVQGTNQFLYVGDANDNWVHSVTQGTETVDGPFKPSPTTVTESMLGETPDAALSGFGPQGISTGASAAIPTKPDAERWVSNCGPTAQSVVDGQTIGNSNPSNPTQGFPNGTWGPISHTYTTTGRHTICPVMYDPHGNRVGGNAGDPGQIIAGGSGHNGDNSVEGNNNLNPCVVIAVAPPEPSNFEIKKEQRLGGESSYTTATLIGKVGQRVEYRITVKDTGGTSLTLGPVSDPNCDSGTLVGPSRNPINPGEAANFTCSRVLTSEGFVSNVATETAEGGGETVTHTSNEVVVEAGPTCPSNTITSKFNGTPIPGEDIVWFNSAVKASGAGHGGTIEIHNQRITFSAGGTNYLVFVTATRITYSTTATKASGEFSESKQMWEIIVPASFGGNVFLSGVHFFVPSGGLPGGINPVTWTGDFATTGGISLSWQWAAAVYTNFAFFMKELGVKLTNSPSLDEYPNGDQAGSPENFKSFVTAGATGGGGANATGSYSTMGQCQGVPTKPKT